MYALRYATSRQWLTAVLENFDNFLLDHAAAEKKASGMAISMLSHYPDRTHLVTAMAELAIEELTHFREVVKILHRRGLQLTADRKDPYINSLREHLRAPKEAFFLDRLLLGSIIEARGRERFGLIAGALEAGELQRFYRAITESEARHEDLFLRLAHEYFDECAIEVRLDELLQVEADICAHLPIRAALH